MSKRSIRSRQRTTAIVILAIFDLTLLWALYAGAPETARAQTSASSASTKSSPGERPTRIDRAPVRLLQDPNAAFVAVAVDAARDEIVLQDENRAFIMVYNRLDNTPASATMTEPKRMIGGRKTGVTNNCGVYVDPANGDIYSLTGDIADTMVIFSHDAKGDVPPQRELKTPHRTYGVAADEQSQELFLTTQHPPSVLVYRKGAEGKEAPLRILEGEKTQLGDVHGIAVDTKNQLMYVANRGATSELQKGKGLGGVPVDEDEKGRSSSRTWAVPEVWYEYFRERFVPGSGKFSLPSITVYPLKASGDTAPLRVIQGPKTQLDWPAHIHLDVEHQELYIANSMADSILVFRASDNGNVAPTRVLKGPQTGIKRPHGVFVDEKNQEIVVANFGNHAATVYPRTADGDAPPIRKIRSAPEGSLSPMFGDVGSLAYDTKRDEILAPN
jgi:DNA-binding beta-propeller fold protein YncE